MQKAEDEYNLYCVYMQSSYLPRMEPSKLLGAYTPEEDPKKETVYSIGAIVEKGEGENYQEDTIMLNMLTKQGIMI